MNPADILGRRLAEAGYPSVGVLPIGAARAHPSRGRYPAHGYVRGWGLEHGGMAEKVSAHPLFREALANSRGRSVVTPDRLMNLFMIITHFFDTIEHHNIFEFGSFRGGSALFMATLLKRLYPDAAMYAHDTFAGMPDVDRSVDFHSAGDFANADLEGLKAAKAELGLDNLHLVQGLVQDTFPGSLAPGTKIGLAHFDMDIYEPTAYAQQVAWPHMTKGGYYIYDDATVSGCIGATQAVEDLILDKRLHSEQVHPHFVFRVGI
ncbi:TylF/MycF/NovP-related O-methyltransferase [Terricaulis sp.]|uniref:TylF/MycF/NovP-related O-methyltransferase n=1 Tax=Terricaulis sp. TaxID=2768686 RepID=UPI003782F347